jgi:acyl-CoA synthetase (AMP-forming)/AMP-acid ligase II
MSSGDVGHFDNDGRLFIDGRDDEMIVSGGENVFPAEVEECLAAHEAVEEVSVIGVDDEKFGQRLKAFVVVREGKHVSEDDLKAYVKDNLANYKTPREVVFLDELPRNPTGKVLKRELAEGDTGDATQDSGEAEHDSGDATQDSADATQASQDAGEAKDDSDGARPTAAATAAEDE